ncbi:MAG TPA: hypothetical protein GX510_03815 [Firmicutes bacterium]|nr:hypothetical protein [Candidatus Fermentithermobacillaceae bacterium]
MKNWLDVLFAIILLEAVVRGFVKGFWVTLLSFAGAVAGLIGAYCFTGPVVRSLESQWHVVSNIERTVFGSLAALPAFHEPFGPATITNISDFVAKYPALRPLAEAAEKALLDILAGRQVSTAGEALAVLFAALLVRTIVFLVLVGVIRFAAMLLARGLDLATGGSIPLRLLGAALDGAVRALWLAILVGGVVYPIVVAGQIPFLRDALVCSRITPYFLGIYQLVARVAFGWIRP